MKAADPREADDLGGRLGLRFDWTPEWRVFAESEVRSVPVVVGEVLAEQAPEMQVIENNDVVEQFAPYRPYKAFRHPVLPWALEARPGGLEPHHVDGGYHRR